jgi:hypothetical protein
MFETTNQFFIVAPGKKTPGCTFIVSTDMTQKSENVDVGLAKFETEKKNDSHHQ